MSAGNLCRPFDSFHPQPPVFDKHYSNNSYRITIRPFCVTTDLELICGWLEEQLDISFQGENNPREELRQSYIDLAASTYAQSFLCLLDDKAICQADVMEFLYSDLALYLNSDANDYFIRLTMSDYATMRNVYEHIVNAMLEYLFSFDEVQRVLTYLPVQDEWSNHLLKEAGFVYLDTRQLFSGVVNIYECKNKQYK